MTSVRVLMAAQIALFTGAALVHEGFALSGYEHTAAATAEALIATVLIVGLALTLLAPDWAHGAAFVTQAFGLLVTLVGLVTIIMGVGPQTLPDVVVHALMIGLLSAGLAVVVRSMRSRLAA